MTHGTIAGILLTDLILGRPNPWERLYDPSRKSLKSAAEYLKENVNVAKQYLDYVSPGEVGSVDEIQPGHGAVMRQGLTKLAVYRDEQRRSPRTLGGVPPPRLHRALELARGHLGLPLPRLAVRHRRAGAEWSGRGWARASGAGERVGGLSTAGLTRAPAMPSATGASARRSRP